jgi:hypothetical protein
MVFFFLSHFQDDGEVNVDGEKVRLSKKLQNCNFCDQRAKRRRTWLRSQFAVTTTTPPSTTTKWFGLP